jgi:hypothetical protein
MVPESSSRQVAIAVRLDPDPLTCEEFVKAFPHSLAVGYPRRAESLRFPEAGQ